MCVLGFLANEAVTSVAFRLEHKVEITSVLGLESLLQAQFIWESATPNTVTFFTEFSECHRPTNFQVLGVINHDFPEVRNVCRLIDKPPTICIFIQWATNSHFRELLTRAGNETSPGVGHRNHVVHIESTLREEGGGNITIGLGNPSIQLGWDGKMKVLSPEHTLVTKTFHALLSIERVCHLPV